MPNKPLLIFPHPTEAVPLVRSGRGSRVPSFDKGQAKRLTKKFQHVRASIKSEMEGDDEKILVMETVGRIEDFYDAAVRIPGLEWLVEFDLEEVDADWDFLYPDNSDAAKEAKKAKGRLYLTVSNREAIDRLVGLWAQWRRNKKVDRGYGKWKPIFARLHDLRFWNHEDMLEESGFMDAYRENIEKGETADGKTTLDFEVEFHFRKNESKRAENQAKFTEKLNSIGGQVNNEVCIPQAGFHALKVSVPIVELKSLPSVNTKGYFLHPDCVKYCRPMSTVEISDDVQENEEMTLAELPPCDQDLPPVIAVLDGMPVLHHQCLSGRADPHDPDNYSSMYENNDKKSHGTSMVSLVCHDDLNREGRETLRRKIYVRPVLAEINGKEEFVPTKFPEDVVFRAVREMFKGDDNVPPTADKVKIINLSLGNTKKMFLHEMSPWARVLDYLSWKHKVLFIISAGNISEEFSNLDAHNGAERIVEHIDKNSRRWRLIAPAESLNGLTVGAINEDGGGHPPLLPENVDFFADIEGSMLAAYSRLGNGYKRQVKPEIIVPGGKMHYRKSPSGNNWHMLKDYPHQGLRHASPDLRGEGVTKTKSTSGTSNAAAVTTHAAGLLYEVIEEIREPRLDNKYDALLIKALLVHGASREGMSSIYRNVLRNDKNRTRWHAYLSKYFGYGVPDFNRVKECTDNRVVILGYGDIEEIDPQRFKYPQQFILPVPAQCRQSPEIKLCATLAWFSPITTTNQYYRRAKLHFEFEGVEQPNREHDWQQVRKGTIQHEVLTFSPSAMNEQIALSVHCYANAGDSLKEESIPYALAVTLEVAEGINIYDEIKTAISQQVPIDPAI